MAFLTFNPYDLSIPTNLNKSMLPDKDSTPSTLASNVFADYSSSAGSERPRVSFFEKSIIYIKSMGDFCASIFKVAAIFFSSVGKNFSYSSSSSANEASLAPSTQIQSKESLSLECKFTGWDSDASSILLQKALDTGKSDQEFNDLLNQAFSKATKSTKDFIDTSIADTLSLNGTPYDGKNQSLEPIHQFIKDQFLSISPTSSNVLTREDRVNLEKASLRIISLMNPGAFVNVQLWGYANETSLANLLISTSNPLDTNENSYGFDLTTDSKGIRLVAKFTCSFKEDPKKQLDVSFNHVFPLDFQNNLETLKDDDDKEIKCSVPYDQILFTLERRCCVIGF